MPDDDLTPLPPNEDPFGEESSQPREFARFDLVTLAKQGIPAPELMCNELMYPGLVHSIAGPPEAGKTTVALWMAAQVLSAGGKVAFFDEESGPDMTADKMISLGCGGEEDLVNFHYFPFPTRNWCDADIAELYALHDREKPVLSIFDSVGAFMALAGMDENKAGDASRFYLKVILPLSRSLNAAILLIDHDTKASEDNGKGGGQASRYGRGSGAKLGAIDVMFKVSPVHAFSRSQDGQVILRVTKDRPGWITPRNYKLDITRQLDVTFSEARGAHAEVDTAQSGLIKLAPAEAKLMSCLNENHAGAERMAARVLSKHHTRLREDTIHKGMSRLVDLGFAEIVNAGGAGRGDVVTWRRKMPGEEPLITAGEVSAGQKRGQDA